MIYWWRKRYMSLSSSEGFMRLCCNLCPQTHCHPRCWSSRASIERHMLMYLPCHTPLYRPHYRFNAVPSRRATIPEYYQNHPEMYNVFKYSHRMLRRFWLLSSNDRAVKVQKWDVIYDLYYSPPAERIAVFERASVHQTPLLLQPLDDVLVCVLKASRSQTIKSCYTNTARHLKNNIFL